MPPEDAAISSTANRQPSPASPAVPALMLNDVSCTFAARDNPAQRYTAVADVSLRIAAGEFVSVVGPTGCGKSTLLNVAAGLLQPSTGTVSVFGQALAGINARAGYMFQAESLMPWRSALANVMAGLEFRGVPGPRAREQAEEWLRRVGLGGFGDRYPHQMSGGMRKRASLAQVLVLDPDIILMDEPFSALDIQTRQLMENEVLALWQGAGRRASPGPGRPAVGRMEGSGEAGEGRKAVLFITHDLDEAIAMSDRVVVMSAGPASHPIGEFTIDLERPRDVAEVRTTPRFIELHKAIWQVLRDEVLKGYQQQLQVKAMG
jgi:NitT/TauT family transport system ATP-binding protein